MTQRPIQPIAWRDGQRIRGNHGIGYGDAISDEVILEHIERSRADSRFVAFARCVLALREYERETERAS